MVTSAVAGAGRRSVVEHVPENLSRIDFISAVGVGRTVAAHRCSTDLEFGLHTGQFLRMCKVEAVAWEEREAFIVGRLSYVAQAHEQGGDAGRVEANLARGFQAPGVVSK